MRILFALYVDHVNDDPRNVRIIKALSMIGEVTVLSLDCDIKSSTIKYLDAGNKGKRSYLKFCRACIRTMKRNTFDMVVLEDNYGAFALKYIGKLKKRPFVVYDSSELYVGSTKIEHISIIKIKGFILRYLETKYIGKSDLIIAANLERALIMKDFFSLSARPIVFENIHKIFDGYDSGKCDEKFGHFFEDDRKTTVFNYGGISESRKTFEQIDAIDRLGERFQLIVSGSATDSAKKKFDDCCRKTNNHNSYYIGYISRSEIKYLLSKCKINVSVYDFSDWNNIFCASGKVYESLFEHVPILASLNPPLKRMCDQYGVGVSTNDFAKGIVQIADNHQWFVNNIKNYVQTIDYDKGIAELAEAIKQCYFVYLDNKIVRN